jgi:hypothetical protein
MLRGILDLTLETSKQNGQKKSNNFQEKMRITPVERQSRKHIYQRVRAATATATIRAKTTDTYQQYGFALTPTLVRASTSPKKHPPRGQSLENFWNVSHPSLDRSTSAKPQFFTFMSKNAKKFFIFFDSPSY